MAASYNAEVKECFSRFSTHYHFVAGYPSTKAKYNGFIRSHVLQHMRKKPNHKKVKGKKVYRTEANSPVRSSSRSANEGTQFNKETLSDLSLHWRLQLSSIESFQNGSIDPFETLSRPITNFERTLIDSCMLYLLASSTS
jgi:hypothetical protein